ncbi:hypothetical protein [Bacteroides sp. ET336]|uniref:hypothetical protein n=1 Tax=Bacteroides sp. ET336 TaxID=2972459 RepID=UPI0021ABB52F|nr:hypothetical protein [Bacteroides sp. ET336]MCR8892510.1 hypothetical protein [Bacteroides sp. ET336]MDN0057006.1 hypothetical protein [Bacteroides caecigallinarum]
MKKKLYETPRTQHVEVELEEGIMNKASVFEPGDGHDKGVSIQGHSFGNSGNYFDNNNGIEGWNDWDN